MNLVESIVSGLLVALGVGLARCLYERWSHPRTAVQANHCKENVLMGRAGKFSKPKLDPGSHQELIDLLYGLHLQAGGQLSVRGIAARTRLSHSTVHKALTRRDLPDLHVVVAIGLALAEEAWVSASGTDCEAYLDSIDHRITKLWRAAAREGSSPGAGTIRAAVERAWSDMAQEWFWLTTDCQKQAIVRSLVLSTTMRAGVVTVHVAVPDWETYHCIMEPAYWHEIFSECVRIYLQYHVGITVEVDEVRDGRPRPHLPRRRSAQPVRNPEYVSPGWASRYTLSLMADLAVERLPAYRDRATSGGYQPPARHESVRIGQRTKS